MQCFGRRMKGFKSVSLMVCWMKKLEENWPKAFQVPFWNMYYSFHFTNMRHTLKNSCLLLRMHSATCVQIPTKPIRMQAAIPCPSGNKGLAEKEKISEQISCHTSVTNSNTHNQGHYEDQLPFHLPDNVYGYMVTGTGSFYTYCRVNKGNREFYGFSYKTKMAQDFWFVNGHLRNYRVWKMSDKGTASEH